MSSLVGRMYNSTEYKELTWQYTSIEGYLFEKLDPLVMAYQFDDKGKCYRFNARWWQSYTIVFETGGFKFSLVFDRDTKIIGIHINDMNGLPSQRFYDLMRKKHNLTKVGANRKSCMMNYELRYSQRNCQRIVEALTTLTQFAYEHQAKTTVTT